jgi:acyl-homoserine-lactone acylase
MRLFIDPDELRALYASSPSWLKDLMDAWADGLNYYLHTHPEVTPRVLTRFEPWMALSFTEGSIGGDIERVNLGRLADFYATDPAQRLGATLSVQGSGPAEEPGTVIAPHSRASWISSTSRPVRTASRSPPTGHATATRSCSSTRTPRSSSVPSYR